MQDRVKLALAQALISFNLINERAANVSVSAVFELVEGAHDPFCVHVLMVVGKLQSCGVASV